MSRAKKSSRTGMARGRMYLKARLGWLSGFPLAQSPGEVTWLALPRFGDRQPEELTFTWRDLHRTSRTWQKLTTRFPRALPRILDDLDHWQEGVPQIISLLSDAIHQNRLLPQSLFEVAGFYSAQTCRGAQALAAGQPALRPWLAAVSWFAYLYPAEVADVLAWSRLEAATIGTILAHNNGLDGIILTQQLWSLTYRDGAELLAPLVQLFGNSNLYTTPAEGAREYSERWTQLLKAKPGSPDDLDYPPRPEPSMGRALIPFIGKLTGRRRQERQYALVLFGLIWPDELLPAWATWWAEMDQLIDQIKEMDTLPAQPSSHQQSLRLHLRRRLHAGRDKQPPITNLKLILAKMPAAAANSAFCEEVIGILPLMPKMDHRVPMRAALFHYWASWLVWLPRRLPILLQYLRESWQKVESQPGRFTPWMPVLSSWHRLPKHRRFLHSVEMDIIWNLPEQRLWPIICDILAASAGVQVRLDSDDAQEGQADGAQVIDSWILVNLAKITQDAAQAISLVASLASVPLKSTYLDSDVLSLAYHLDNGQEKFGRLVTSIASVAIDEYRAVAQIRSAAEQLEGRGWLGLAAELILDDRIKQLALIGLRLQALDCLELSVPPPSPLPPQLETPGWVKYYPETLWPVLRLLAALHPAAREAAARVLKDEFPDDARLRREIEWLRQELAANPTQANLARRLASLEQRSSSPHRISAQRLANLEEKLRRLVAQEALAVWEGAIEDAMRPALKSEIGVDDLPSWLLAPREVELIAHILQLPVPFRQLAFRLLRLRCGPLPWSLADDPANRQFVATLEGRGLNVEPWLNPPGPRQFTGNNGRVVELSFESDPLEIFQMGSHFNTCLSVGDFNFFSVFANTADINKHVIYARDERQQVVGRCLLALTEEGSLLTFEPYCHDPELGFGKMMAEIIADLSAQTGAPVHITGRVPPLVAANWYDDGPRDVTGRFKFLEPGSAFRQAIPGMTPEAFLQELEAQFDPLPLNALGLTLILDLPELNQQPTLVRPLLPYLQAEKTLPDQTMLMAVYLADQAGETQFVRHILRSWAPAYLQRSLRDRYGRVYLGLIKMLAEHDPSAALRYLRRSRPPGVRRDEEESGWRRGALAIAHDNLGRYILAERLREGLSA